jgi:uncharacterized lipoprotein YmbA
MAATETNDLVRARVRHREAPRRSLAIAAISAALLLAGCGSSSHPSTTSLVKKNWAEFFAGSTPVSTRVRLLQDGAQFAHALQQQTSSSYTRDVNAMVSKVQVTSSTSASVHYDLYLNGLDVLPDQQGIAIKQSGTWKVSASSFCSLLALESVDAPGCPRS